MQSPNNARRYAAFGLVLMLLAGCQRTPQSVPGAEAPFSKVETFGTLIKSMHEGQTGSVFRIRDANSAPHAFAVGALSGLRGEVTILDGAIWLAYPDGARPRVEQTSETSEEATLFVVSHVRRWRAVDVRARVPFGKLDAFVERTAIEAGMDASQPFPVRIEGPMFVRWHVVDGSKLHEAGALHADHVRSAVTGQLDGTGARLVGFFGQSAQGVFTHMGQRTHFHVIDPSSSVMGHVDEVEIGEGARILLPDLGNRP